MISRRRALQGSLTIGLAAALPTTMTAAWAQTPEPINDRMTGDLSPVHDPCIIREGDTYYVYCTTMRDDGQAQLSMRVSKDLLSWKKIGDIFPEIPAWMKKEIPDVRALWAPDITLYRGKYWLYYAGSTFGTNVSAIGLATNATLDPSAPNYRWEDHGLVFRSHKTDDYNCIDPSHVIDRHGGSWLAFGSFWSGIKIMQLDPATGKPRPGDRKLHGIAERPTPEGGLDTIEANFIIERGGYYYLFASYDYCCKGVNSTYYTAYGRSKHITGPYLDKKGRSMMNGYGEVILKADQEEKGRWRGPGHCAILRDRGQDYIVYHAYDKENKKHPGMPNLRIAPLVWSKDGWATALM
ncbi:MAG: arabinan endo-1,5-alpha-L-arabinosidase [Rhizomicrobium sp.]